MKTKIDLLPPWAQNAKARKKNFLIFFLAQIAVFLFLAAIVFLLNAWEEQTWNRSRELSEKIAATHEPQNTPAIFLEEIMPFAGEWLDFIAEAVPDGVILTHINYSHEEFLISGTASDIILIEAHRASLTEFFTYVQQGRITRTDCGNYAYEIRIFVTGE